MRLINKLSSNSIQRVIIQNVEGSNLELMFRFYPTINKWCLDITYGSFVLNGIAITNSPNFLRKFRNIIPFGMSCSTFSGIDPRDVDDFEKENALLYLLDKTDVAEIENGIFK